jgi:aspartyl-tRNA(Asn)/glutamyl-tRNA(Gln) amidotransferase subunit B
LTDGDGVGDLTDGFELVIGVESHVQLVTKTKMFCRCSADYDGAEPNTLVCPVCLGLPGSLPAPNERALELATTAALALGCTVDPRARFDRKNYHYPDLAKGYQITQYARPLGVNGNFDFADETGLERRVRIERVHLEEDTAKLQHAGDHSLADFNRSGVPLIEIVTGPDMSGAEDAKLYLEGLRQLLRWLGLSTGNMQSGALRADVNVSVRAKGSRDLGVKVEVKNLNSFAAVVAAIEYERDRMVALIEGGEQIPSETRGWIEAEARTQSQRSKELAHDYRYFPEPDLPPLGLDTAWVDGLRAALPELPMDARRRFVAADGVPAPVARLLARDRATAAYYEAARAAYRGEPGNLAHWITGPLFGLQNSSGLSMDVVATRVAPGRMAGLAGAVDGGSITRSAGRDVLERMFAEGASADEIIAREGLGLIDDETALRVAVADAISANPDAVDDFCGGKTAAIAFLVGRVMHATRGQADPNLVRELLGAGLAARCAEAEPLVGDRVEE